MFGATTGPLEGGSSSNEVERVEYIVTYALKIDETHINLGSQNEQVHIVYKVDNTNYPIYTVMDNFNFHSQFPNFIEKYGENLFIVQNNLGPWLHIDTKEALPTALVIDNTTISGSQEFKAFESVFIGNNVSITNGSDIHLTAGKFIEVDELFEGEEMLHLNIGLNPSSYIGVCVPENYAHIPDLNDECAVNSEYFIRSRIFTKTEEGVVNFPQKQVEIIHNVSLFPNPTFEFTSVHFNILKDSKITVELLDVKGQLLNQLAHNKFYPIGDFEIPLSLQDLNQGVYLLSFTDENGLKKVYKIIKY